VREENEKNAGEVRRFAGGNKSWRLQLERRPGSNRMEYLLRGKKKKKKRKREK